MGTVKVNCDLFMYKVPNEETGLAPVARAARLGDIIDIDAAQEKRGRATLINRDYPYGNTTVRSVEPSLVDVDHDANVSAAEAARQARLRQIMEEAEALGGLPEDVPLVDDGADAAAITEKAQLAADAILADAQLEAERIRENARATTLTGSGSGVTVGNSGNQTSAPPAPPTPPSPPAPPVKAAGPAKKSATPTGQG